MLVSVQAQESEHHITLLAVSDKGDSYEGSIADLFLKVGEGSGRIFIDSHPLTKIDTQISNRFAKEIVCEQFGRDCEHYDFFYTIRANSVIVGGPSAGAASALLTLAALDDQKINESVAITGTINSGGLIGPVGGILKKIEAAAEEGITTVLIPEGERFVDEEGVVSDAIEYGVELGVDVREVSDIYEAAKYVFNVEYPRKTEEPEIDISYAETMTVLADGICTRTGRLSKGIDNLENTSSILSSKPIIFSA